MLSPSNAKLIPFISLLLLLGCSNDEKQHSEYLLDNPMSVSYLDKHLQATQPRLVNSPDVLKNLKQKLESDPVLINVYEAIHQQAHAILGQPLLERKQIGRRLLSVSREMLKRINLLGTVYLIEEDLAILSRINEELLAVCAFSDWNPSHFLDVAEMAMAVALALDWTAGHLPDETIATAKAALLEKALSPSWPEQGGADHWWVKSNNNWNQVCHGGLIAAAITVAEDEPEVAAKTISRALEHMPKALSEYVPDGVYPEGPTYWSYGTSFSVMTIEMLRSAFDQDFGISAFPGFMESAEFVAVTKAPSGLYYNFADCGDRPSQSGDPILAWFAAETGNTNYFDDDLFLSPAEEMSLSRICGAALIWMARYEPSRTSELPHSWFGQGTNPIAIFADPEGDRGYFFGAKGGAGILNHGNMDGGSFIFELDGVRWVVDPGVQPYHELEKEGFNLWSSCQTCDRWKLLTKNNFGHSTITVNGELHVVDGHAEMINSVAGDQPEVTFDLSPTFAGFVQSAKRTFKKNTPVSLLIEDEIVPSPETKTICWQLLTTAAVKLTDDGAILKKDGQELQVQNLSHPDITLAIMDLDPPPFKLDKRIENLKRLELVLQSDHHDSEGVTIRIRLLGQPN